MILPELLELLKEKEVAEAQEDKGEPFGKKSQRLQKILKQYPDIDAEALENAFQAGYTEGYNSRN